MAIIYCSRRLDMETFLHRAETALKHDNSQDLWNDILSEVLPDKLVSLYGSNQRGERNKTSATKRYELRKAYAIFISYKPENLLRFWHNPSISCAIAITNITPT